MSKQRPLFICTYRDGSTKVGTYRETLLLFQEAKDTDNPCTVRSTDTEYRTS